MATRSTANPNPFRAATHPSVLPVGGVSRPWTSVQWMTLIFVLSAHAVLWQAMIMQPMFLTPTTSLPTMLSIPISQVALASLWAMSGGRVYLRIVLTMLFIIASWLTVMRYLGTVNSVGAAHWLAGFVAEATVIALGCLILRHRSGERHARQFGLFSLMVWTALIAIVLVLLKIGRQRFGWSSGLAANAYFWGMPFFFVGFGLTALAVATVAVSQPHQMPRRAAWGLAIVAAVSIGMPIVAQAIWPTQDMFTCWHYFKINACEVIAISATCYPLLFLLPIQSSSQT